MTCPSDSKAMVKGILLAALAAALVTGCDSREVLVEQGATAPITVPTSVVPETTSGGPVGGKASEKPKVRVTPGPKGEVGVKRDDRPAPRPVVTPKPSPKKASPTATKKVGPSKVEDKPEAERPALNPTGPDGKETPVTCPIVYDEESRPVFKC